MILYFRRGGGSFLVDQYSALIILEQVSMLPHRHIRNLLNTTYEEGNYKLIFVSLTS
jgi:hypothetical protein